jgi:hypothetical protein
MAHDVVGRIAAEYGVEGSLRHQGCDARAPRSGAADVQEGRDVRRDGGRQGRGVEAEVLRPGELRLAHRNAREALRQHFVHSDKRELDLEVRRVSGGLHVIQIGRELLQRANVGREPCETVERTLMAVYRVGLAIRRQHLGDRRPGALLEIEADGGDGVGRASRIEISGLRGRHGWRPPVSAGQAFGR